MNNDEIKLSVCTVTYNQKDYIAQALDSFLMQKTNFKFQVIVGDDCSTDGTTEILKEYAEKYPDIIKPIFRKKNIGPARNSLDVYDNAKTPYVAICDGDDYWTDENKLQKQVDFLETHPNYSVCFHFVKVVYEGFDKHNTTYPMEYKDYSFEELLRFNFIQTNSVVYRWIFHKNDIKDIQNTFLDIAPGDYYIHLLHAKQGKIKMFPDIMSVYRRHFYGIWAKDVEKSEILLAQFPLQIVNFYYSVYKTITDSSQAYLNEQFYPNLNTILDACYRQRKFKDLQLIYDKYKQYVDNIIDNVGAENSQKVLKKYKKYKKLFNFTLSAFVVLFVVLCIILVKLI